MPINPYKTKPRRQSAPLPPVTNITPSTQPPKTSRRPENKASKYAYYAVRNGSSGNNVYLSWPQAVKYCWDYVTNSVYTETTVKGFNNFDDAWNWTLSKQHPKISTTPPIPPEPVTPAQKPAPHKPPPSYYDVLHDEDESQQSNHTATNRTLHN